MHSIVGYLIHHSGFCLCSAHFSSYGWSSGNSMLKLRTVYILRSFKNSTVVCYLKHNHYDEITDLCEVTFVLPA